MAKSPAGSPPKTPVKKDLPIQKPGSQGGFDLAIAFLSRFNRFGWDIVGILTLALSGLTLIGVLGLTRGAWISPWVNLLNRFLGWGSILVVLGLAVAGIISLRHQFLTRGSFHLGRILALEGAAFAALALLSIFSNASVDQAFAGLDRGGVIGWGLAELLLILVGPTWQAVVATGAIILFAILGSGVPELLVRAIDHQLGQDGPDPIKNLGSDPGPWLPAATQKTTSEPGASPAQKREDQKQSPRVAASFKKKLQAPAARSEKPAQLPPRDERLPPLNLLIGEQNVKPDERIINQTAGLIEQTLSEFGVPAKVIGYRIGPTVTQFAVEPGFMEKPGPDGTPQLQKVRVSQIQTLAKDLTLALSAERLRIEAPVPGQSFVGIEVPNSRSTVVKLRPILEFGSILQDWLATGDRHGPRCLRTAGCGRSGTDASFIDCRDNRFRQVCVHRSANHLPGGEQQPGRFTSGDDRSENGGTGAV